MGKNKGKNVLKKDILQEKKEEVLQNDVQLDSKKVVVRNISVKNIITILAIILIISLFFFFLTENLLIKATEKDYSVYVNKNLMLSGNYLFQQTTCRNVRDCDYLITFSSEDNLFYNLTVYKNNVLVTCFDEYSKEIRKYLRVTCGVRYVDLSVNREKYEQISISTSKVNNVSFVMRRINSTYVLEMQ
ncbi:MAG: hypothetical protein WC755_03885 [Candidatus Woesearchaeota archaeon]